MGFLAGLLLVPFLVVAQGEVPPGRTDVQRPPLMARRVLENLRTGRYSGRPIDLVVSDRPLAAIFAELERADGLRFELDPKIRERASYTIRRTPWDEVLARVLSDNRLRLDLDLEGTGFKVHRGRVQVLAFESPARLGVVTFVYRNLGRLTAALGLLLAAATAYAALRWRAARRRPGEKKALLPPEKAEEARRRLLVLFETDRIHLREDLSLRDLAGELGVTPHQLSWLINDVLGLSFSSLVNGYRVAAAKARLADPSLNSATILGVGLEAGFGTKAAFNRAFKKHTGMTPSEYRNSVQK